MGVRRSGGQANKIELTGTHGLSTGSLRLEFNARNQVTLWGPNGEINDYAAKSWGGLVKKR